MAREDLKQNLRSDIKGSWENINKGFLLMFMNIDSVYCSYVRERLKTFLRPMANKSIKKNHKSKLFLNTCQAPSQDGKKMAGKQIQMILKLG